MFVVTQTSVSDSAADTRFAGIQRAGFSTLRAVQGINT